MSSSVLLGIIDEPFQQNHIDWSTNKIGGSPDWVTVPNDDPCCQECKNKLILVVQLYCPLQGSIYHRTLYLFKCLTCKDGRWELIRQQKQDDSAIKIVEKQIPATVYNDDWGVGKDDWGVDTDDWGTDADDWGTDGNTVEQTNCNDLGSGVEETGQINGDSTAVISNQKKYSNFVPNLECLPSPDENSPLECDLNCDISDRTENSLVSDLSNMEIENTDDSSENQTKSENVIVEDNMVDSERTHNVMTILGGSGDCHVTDIGSKQCLMSYYVNVIEEPEDSLDSGEKEHIKKLLKNYEKEQGAIDEQLSSSGSSNTGEKYEKSIHIDKYFHQFSKRIGRSQEQVIRYEWNGSPLYISKPGVDLLQASQQSCPNCGSALVFELQIMPALINSLRFDKAQDSGIEYGTVIMYTCKASCWTDTKSHYYEHVFIQADPDQHLFKQNMSNKMPNK